MSYESALSARVRQFVADITHTARTAAEHAIKQAFPGAPARRGRRTAAAAAHYGPRVVSYLLARPGSQAPELRRQLGLGSAPFRAIIRSLAAQGLVRFEGNTRARTYFAMEAATTRTPSISRQPQRRRAGR